MPTRLQKHVGSCYIHFPNLCTFEDLASRWIFDLSVFKADLGAHLQQTVPSVYPAIRKNYWIILDIALGMMCIGETSCELVELGRADGTDSGDRGASV